MLLKKLGFYLNPLNWFKKSDTDNVNLRFMHGTNKLSIILFLFCLCVMLYRWFLR